MIALKRLIFAPMRAAIVGAFCLSAPVAVLAPAVPAAAQQDNSISEVESALRAISTLRADFTQSDRLGNVVAGELTWRNTGHIRFEYTDENMLIVSNGRTLFFVDYDIQREERWPIRNSPLGALLDPDRDLSRYGSAVPTNAPNVVSIAVEDPERPEFPQITLIFLRKASAPGGLELVSWVALDAQNNRTTIRLRNHRYGTEVRNSEFRYRDPRPSSRRPR